MSQAVFPHTANVRGTTYFTYFMERWCFLLFVHHLANVLPRGSGQSLARMKEIVCLDLIGLSLIEIISGHFLFNCIVLSPRCFVLTHCRCSLSPFLLQCGSLLPRDKIPYFPFPLWSISGDCKIYSMSIFTKYHLSTSLLHDCKTAVLSFQLRYWWNGPFVD